VSGHRHFTSDGQATGFDAKPAAEAALVVGQIETVVGSCSLTRPGGDPFQVKRGDPICRGDILETTAGGKVGIRFIDGTAFNLSDNARAIVKEFGDDGNEPSAQFDISRGTFAFIAGEMAKRGGLRIETPFASIRGRAQSGGIGMLSLASLFFAALENAQGATTFTALLHGTEDGIINIRESSDIINAQFGIIELTVGGQTIFIDNPFFEWIVRGTSVSQVALNQTQLLQHQVESNNVQSIASLGQGPTVGGPSGSSELPPPGPPPFVTPINNPGPTGPSGPTGGPGGGGGGSGGAGPDIFIPPPPPPPPPPPAGPNEINEKFDTTGSPEPDTTSGSLPASIVSLSAPSFVWSGGPLSDGQKAALAAAITPPAPGSTTFDFSILDHAVDLIAFSETLTITYQVTFSNGTTQPVVVTVFGTNDAPHLAVDTSGPHEFTELANPTGNSTADATGGTLTFTDVDFSDTHTVSKSLVSAVWSGGATLPSGLSTALGNALSLTLHDSTALGSGSIDFAFSLADSNFDFLAEGETLTIKYNVSVIDSNHVSSIQQVTVTATGTNDAPEITSSAQSATLAEASETAAQDPSANAGNLHTTGTLNFTDVDITDANHTADVMVSQSGTTNAALTDAIALGLFNTVVTNTAAAANGTIDWTFDGSEALFDYLNNGEHLTLTYTITVSDEALTSNQQTVTITINGANDSPVITSSAQSATLAEVSETAAQDPSANAGNLHTTGTLNFTDIDITDADHAPHVSVSQSGTTNAALTNAVALTLFNTVVTNTAAAANGTIDWTFDGSEALFDYLNNGESLILTYTITTSDESLTSNSQTVTITINGANDSPVITSSAQSATLAEVSETAAQNPPANAGNLHTTGTLNFTDVDITDTGHTRSVTVAQSGTTNPAITETVALGLFSTIVTNTAAAADGTIDWTFDGSEALFDYLNNGESLVLTYTITVSDEALTSNQQTVTITINGANDSPVITSSAQSATLAEVSETAAQNPPANAGNLHTTGTLNFTDIDISDAGHTTNVTVAQSGTTNSALTNAIALGLFSTVVTNTATAANGTIAWTFDGSEALFDYLNNGEHLTLTYTITASDEALTSNQQTVTITINGANDAPIITSGPQTATLAEAAETGDQNPFLNAGDLITSSTLNFTDVDITDANHSRTVSVAQSGNTNPAITDAVALSLFSTVVTNTAAAADGTVAWTFDGPENLFDYLNQGEHLTFTYTIRVADEALSSNTQTVTITVNGANDAPVLKVNGAYALDQFNTQDYGAWVEQGNDSNGAVNGSPLNGEFQVAHDPTTAAGNFQIRLTDLDAESANPDTLSRTFNLVGAGNTAKVEFDYRRDIPSGQSNDQFIVFASINGGAFTQIGQIGATGNGSFVDGSYQHFTFDLSSGSAIQNVTLRFSVGDDVDDGDVVYVDNVKLSYTKTATTTQTVNYTENSAVGVFAQITDVDQNATVHSATITIANHQTSDLLSVTGTLPGGIVASSYDAATGVLTLTGTASLAQYQDALSHILFSNTSDNPDTTDRTLTITVNDGLADSNVAATTIHVTAIDDLPFATADNVITNFGTNTAFQIPTSALLANDQDLDNPLSITSVSGGSSGSASLGAGFVTFTDTGGSGGSFSYTATGGAVTTNATVTISQDTTGALDGTSANDILIAKSGAVTMNGNGGDDILIGNTGAQLMNGNAGNDTFVFRAIADSQPGAGNFDTIGDFTHNGDHLDLTAIAGANIVQGLVNSQNTVDAHSISWFVDNVQNQTIVYVNTTGTSNHVDMEIHLTGTNISLSGSDILHHT
jgi:VCBS repeat-containing protein